MVEIFLPAVIAIVTGGAMLTSRIYTRLLDLDKRIDTVELSMAQAYVSKSDFKIVLDRVETHMLRIEDKLDTIVANGKCNAAKQSND